MIDRGADLAWVSQYPHEREYLFAPLTGIEVLSHRVEEDLLVVSVRPSVNLNAMTIEGVMNKMKDSYLSLVDLLTNDLTYAGVPQLALAPLTSLKLEAKDRDPLWFNSTRNCRGCARRSTARSACSRRSSSRRARAPNTSPTCRR